MNFTSRTIRPNAGDYNRCAPSDRLAVTISATSGASPSGIGTRRRGGRRRAPAGAGPSALATPSKGDAAVLVAEQEHVADLLVARGEHQRLLEALVLSDPLSSVAWQGVTTFAPGLISYRITAKSRAPHECPVSGGECQIR